MTTEESRGQLSDLVRWGLRADALSAEASRLGAAQEGSLRRAARAVGEALTVVSELPGTLDPTTEQVRRIEEIAGVSLKSSIRTDLLALNFQVEAARLGDQDRGLEEVAHEIRTLADRGTRRAEEVDELARRLEHDLSAARGAWLEGRGHFESARDKLESAIRALDRASGAWAEARSAAAEFGAAARVAGHRERAPDTDLPVAARLAAAVEVREATINHLARTVASRLGDAGGRLRSETLTADEVAVRLASFVERLDQLTDLMLGADEIARRAKQLALNADLASARSDDPAFNLFAEEARRLSDLADGTATATQSQLHDARQALTPGVEASRRVAQQLGRIAHDLAGLQARFGEEDSEAPAGESLTHAWREDRAAARQLAQARADWHAGPNTAPEAAPE